MDIERVAEFAERINADGGAVFNGVLTYLGDRLGIYRAMTDAGPLTTAELAGRTGYHERYLREWLSAQAAAGYLAYDPSSGRFALPDEHAAVLAIEGSPANIVGQYEAAAAVWDDRERIAQAFRTGEGVAWGDHSAELFRGVERFYAAGYRASLLSEWLPALDGVVARLERGARVLDVGCGHGMPTILMAQTYPASTFTGVDTHAPSIEAARKAAGDAGVTDRMTFEVATADGYGGSGYDLICLFDTLHDLGDPIGAATHAREALVADGVLMVVEPLAADRLEDNLHPLGLSFYAASTLLCTPNALSQDGGIALGAQAGPARLREVLAAGGFASVDVAAQTEVNLVLEARP